MNHRTPAFTTLAIASLALACLFAGCGDSSDPAAPQGVPPSTGGAARATASSITAESLYPLFERYARVCEGLTPLAQKLASGKSLTPAESDSYNSGRADLWKVYAEINDIKKKNPRAKPRIREAFEAKTRTAADHYASANKKVVAAVKSGKTGSWTKDPVLDNPAEGQRLMFEELDATSAFGISAR